MSTFVAVRLRVVKRGNDQVEKNSAKTSKFVNAIETATNVGINYIQYAVSS